MKANKDNCSVSYHGTEGVSLGMYNYISGNTDLKPRVIEVPKVIREDGKQYKVWSFTAPFLDNHCVIKAPWGCRVDTHGGDYEVEYYD